MGVLPQACTLGPEVLPGGACGAAQDELAVQVFGAGPPRVVLVTTAGVLQLERRRPVDVLQAMLQV